MAWLPVPALAPGCQSSWPQRWEEPWSWHGELEELQSPGKSQDPAELRTLHLCHIRWILPEELSGGSDGVHHLLPPSPPLIRVIPIPSVSPQQHREPNTRILLLHPSVGAWPFKNIKKNKNGPGKEAEKSLKREKILWHR